jgi:hypothetical protein
VAEALSETDLTTGETREAIILVIPSRKDVTTFLLYPVVITIGAGGALFFAVAALSTPWSNANLLALAFVAVIFVLLAWQMLIFLWAIGGRDVLELGAQSVIWRREIFGAAWTRHFTPEAFRNLRTSPFHKSWWGKYAAGRMAFSGPLTFDYGLKTYRFGGIDEAEAKELVSRVGKWYPQYVASNYRTTETN